MPSLRPRIPLLAMACDLFAAWIRSHANAPPGRAGRSAISVVPFSSGRSPGLHGRRLISKAKRYWRCRGPKETTGGPVDPPTATNRSFYACELLPLDLDLDVDARGQ